MKIHPTSVVAPVAYGRIGDGTVVGPMCEIGPKAVIGRDCRLEHCTVEGRLGDRVKVWRYAHVMEDAEVGDDSQVCNGAIVLSTARVGQRCDIQLWAGIARLVVIEDDVYIGPNVVFCNAKNPRRGEKLQAITVKKGASVGANCSILYGVTIGEGATIGAGTVVTKDVPAGATVIGPPGVIR